MDPISIVASIGSILGVAQHTVKLFYRYNEVAEARNLLMSIEISLLRLQQWNQKWFKEGDFSRVKAKELWGEPGVSEMDQVIQDINHLMAQLSQGPDRITKGPSVSYTDPEAGLVLPPNLTKEVEKTVEDMDRRKRRHKRFSRFLKKATIRPTQDTTRELSLKVGELELLSRFLYQIIHGIRSVDHGNLTPFLKRSVVFRQAAVNLWDKCRCDKFPCSLGVDMLPDGLDKTKSMPLHLAIDAGTDKALCYSLIWNTEKKCGYITLKDTVHGPPLTPRSTEQEKPFKRHMHDLVSSDSPHRDIVCLSSKYYSEVSRFRVENLRMQISPYELAKFSSMHTPKETSRPNSVELLSSLSLKERVKLASKLAECGTQLLGTPWFASLMHRRLDHIWVQRDASKMDDFRSAFAQMDQVDRQPSAAERPLFEKDLFTLSVPCIRLEDIVVQDSGVIAEHQQLFYFGVLLIQLALGEETSYDPKFCGDSTLWASKLLPRVTQEVGMRYTEACAFCVGVPRKGHWESCSPKKYAATKDVSSWREYMERFTGDFYIEVYMRLFELAETMGNMETPERPKITALVEDSPD